jgi:hypothetical protein
MFSRTRMTMRRFGIRALIAFAAAAFAASAAAAASTASTRASCGTTPATWPSHPRVLLHVGEMKPSVKDWVDTADGFGTQLQLLVQATDAVNQFNAIGATSARVSSVETTRDPFTYRGSYSDSVPTIHVGFQPALKVQADNGGKPAAGLTTMPIYLSNNCSPTVTIEFPDLSSKAWSFSSPFALSKDGARFYDAGRTAPAVDGGGEYFRPSFLHELMHGFGLQHVEDDYAMMNHRGAGDPNGGFPWANRAETDAVRPLPNDVAHIRDLYPASGSRWEVAPLNTWFHVTTDSTGKAADQVKLCTPSLGDKFSGNQTTSGPCGVGGDQAGSTQVDEGEWLRTRFALANYSTGSMHVTTHLWLSADEQLSDGDYPALSYDVRDIDKEKSDLAEVAFKLPWLPDGTYHPIVQVSSQRLDAAGQAVPGEGFSDWIPLRGVVNVCHAIVCSTPSF